MSDPEILKTKKDALVAALTQLSNAAQDASRACIDFYAAASIPGAPPVFGVPPAAAALLPAAQISSSSDESTIVAAPVKRGPKKAVAEAAAPAEAEEDVIEVETSGKKVKRKRIIDPDAPRRPQTVYFAFANEARKLIRDEYQAKGIEATNTEIIREVAERWKNMSDEQKEPWKAIYAEQIKRYDEEKAAYNAGKEIEKKKDGEPPAKKKKKARSRSLLVTPSYARAGSLVSSLKSLCGRDQTFLYWRACIDM
ncbi:high mobility group box domain-containing protein [Lipomyces tetrasporus]|uniref:High mobility group box domain-containing protein n=1 Tax=Lipomyces tetrasporus TaxID=54092 RepID=A0AAD7QLG0_9ASCO|nr:high mobility group box domain-containing protein [Lipomyces tetrasporus]KAJ8097384.1 high mobility group box domain-containing protein [Lipomyces tetrasporus]